MIPMRRKAAAARAWAKLCALDTAAAERTQLVAAGVASHRIDALYPEVGFASIEAPLIGCLASLPISQLTTASGINSLRDNFTANLRSGYDFPRNAPSPWVEAHAAADSALGSCVSTRIEAEALSSFLTYNNAMAHAYNLVTGIYWAWWGMKNRAGFPLSDRQRADKLMLGVANILDLDGGK